MSEYFEYIDENLEKIKNPNHVMMIRTHDCAEGGKVLGATFYNGQVIPLTQPKRLYPKEPIYWFYDIMGEDYWGSFEEMRNEVAINKNYLKAFQYQELDNKRVVLYAVFINGYRVKLAQPERKLFIEKWKSEIEEIFEMQFEDITEEVKQQNEIKR